MRESFYVKFFILNFILKLYNSSINSKLGDDLMTREKIFSLNANQLKIIAIIAMFLNHLSIFLDPEESSVLLWLLIFIGRTTLPIMAYFLVIGFHKSSNVDKYLLRLGIFAIVSYIPFIFAFFGEMPNRDNFLFLNVIYTLFLSLLLLKLVHSKMTTTVKILLIPLLFFLATYGDWGTHCLFIVLLFDLAYGDFKKQAIFYSIYILIGMGIIYSFVGLIFGLMKNDIGLDSIFGLANLGMFVPLILLSFYDGERGKSSKASKWGFYLFYPLHLLILGLINYYLF